MHITKFEGNHVEGKDEGDAKGAYTKAGGKAGLSHYLVYDERCYGVYMALGLCLGLGYSLRFGTNHWYA